MSSTPFQGRLGRLKVSADNVTFYNLGYAMDFSLSGSKDMIDTTHHESAGGWEENIAGLRSAEISGSCSFVDGDSGQGVVADSFFNNTKIYCKFRMNETSGDPEYTCLAECDSWEADSPHDDKGALDINLKVSGAISRATQ